MHIRLSPSTVACAVTLALTACCRFELAGVWYDDNYLYVADAANDVTSA